MSLCYSLLFVSEQLTNEWLFKACWIFKFDFALISTKLFALLLKALAKFRGKRNVINVISQFSFLVSLAIVWHKQMSMSSTPKYVARRTQTAWRMVPLPHISLSPYHHPLFMQHSWPTEIFGYKVSCRQSKKFGSVLVYVFFFGFKNFSFWLFFGEL